MESHGSRSCPNCTSADRDGAGADEIIGHGSFRTRSGRNQRWLCGTCRRSYCARTGTVYFGLHCTDDEFDLVAKMRVEGVSISAIARIPGRSRSTITRWLERAAGTAKRFNDEQLRDFEIKELQADELCTFVAAKTNATWVCTTVEVSSRLWPGCVVGRRSYRNTERIFNQTVRLGRIVGLTLVTTDGFEFYQRVVRTVLGVAAVYGQVVKTRRNNRVQRVQRSMKLGTAGQLDRLLLESEDSETLNTSFVERLNLTLRQSLAYLQRRCPAHARCLRRLDEDLALVQCHYNFIRPHRALKFGTSCKTPAMQAGIITRRLLFRDIFTQQDPSGLLALILTFSIRRPAPISDRSAALLAV